MFRTIIAAVDPSPAADVVVQAALEVAERFDAQVHLLRVVILPPEFPAAAHQPHDELPKVLAAEAARDLERLARLSSRIHPLPPHVGIRQPWREILRVGDELDADLLVVGSHGFSGWDRVLGTNSGRVADRANRSVLVVHERRAQQGQI